MQGVQAVADFIETELSPEEVLDAMGSVILLRNRHSLLDGDGGMADSDFENPGTPARGR